MRRIYITYPEHKTDLQLFCRESVEKHQPDWEIVEILSPILAKDWPISSQYFTSNQREIVRSDLVRLEAVWNTGGIYLDSDIYLLQPIDHLLDDSLPTFWNANPAPQVSMSWLNAVFAAPPRNQLIEDLIHASAKGIERCDPSLATACLTGYSAHLAFLDPENFKWLGTDEIVFSDYIGNIKHDSYQDIVDMVVNARENLPFAIHLTQHTWRTTNTF